MSGFAIGFGFGRASHSSAPGAGGIDTSDFATDEDGNLFIDEDGRNFELEDAR